MYSLVLKIRYDSGKLTWNGLKNDQQNTVHGFKSDPDSPGASDLNPIKNWDYSRYGGYGELKYVVDASENDNKYFDDGNTDTNRLTGIMWSMNVTGRGTFPSPPGTDLGFVGNKEYPFELFTTSFTATLKEGEETRIIVLNSKTTTNTNNLKSKSIIVSKKNGIISAKLDEDYSYQSEEIDKSTLLDEPTDPEDPNSVDCTDCKYIEIKPDVETISFDPQTDQDVSFSVDYSVDTNKIPNLYLYMHYDANKLHWNGLEKDSVLGLSDPLKINGPPEDQPIIKEGWKNTSYGEFRQILHLFRKEAPGYFKGRDSTISGTALISWSRPEKTKRTFVGGSSKGFVKDIPKNLRLFKTSFTPNPGFVAGETTRVSLSLIHI